MISTRLRRLAGLALASTVLLTGCGSVPGFNPGVAARVGDQTISMDRVDEVTTSYCEAAERQLQEGQVLPQHYLRGQVAGALALRAAADRFAAEHGVSPDVEYDQAVQQAEQSLSTLPEDERQAIIDVQGVSVYVGAVEKSVGMKLRQEQGRSTSDEDAVRATGHRAFSTWLEDQDIELDPRFGVSIDGGKTAASDTSLSYAVSDTAKSADAGQPDTTYAAGLPDNQRCG